MRDRHEPRDGLLRSLARRLRGRSRQAQAVEGVPCIVTGRQALFAVEALVCDALCRNVSEAGASGGVPRVNAFGTPLLVRDAADVESVVAVACGMAAAGRRVAAFVGPVGPSGIGRLLRAAVERRLPLVLHVARDREHPVDVSALADTGAFVVVPGSLQEAVDHTLASRVLAERSLTPGVVVLDGPRIHAALQDVVLPDASMVRDRVGDPHEAIESPTPAQRLLFGERRPRLPAWFDPDHAVSHAARMSGTDLEAAAIGRRGFFSEHLEALAIDALSGHEAIFGQALDPLTAYRIADARHVLVTQGSAVELASEVADRLRDERRAKIGVLGWTWMRPAPREAIGRALARLDSVTVLEPAPEGPTAAAPLLSTLRGLELGVMPRTLSATYRMLTAAQMEQVLLNMEARDGARPTLHLTSFEAGPREGYPRLQALEQRVARDYPELGSRDVPPEQVLDLRPEDATSLTLLVRGPVCPDRTVDRLIARIAPGHEATHTADAVTRLHARGRTRRRRPGLWEIHVTLSADALGDPGDGLDARVGLILGAERAEEAGRPFDLARGGSLVVATARSATELWADLPPAWREMILDREIRLFRVEESLDALLGAAATPEGVAEEIPWREISVPEEADRALPLGVRRFDATGTGYGNVSRFWGEYAQPLDGGAFPPAPDPYLALGVMPACSSTFRDRTPRRERHPRLDPERCTGCGTCWTSCPDSAIAPVALKIRVALDAAADRAALPESEAAAKLRRAHAPLAQRIGRELLQSGARRFNEPSAREAYARIADRLAPEAEERARIDEIFESTLGSLARLPWCVTDTFFHEAERESKGAGELALLAFNPQACQACGICAQVCPEGAIDIVPQTAESLEAMRRLWNDWEELPDTSGASIARAAAHPRVGPLPAVLLSRHCLFSMAGGDNAERGSGARIAARQVSATVEYRMQRRILGQAERLERLHERIQAAVEVELGRAVQTSDLGAVREALVASPERLTGSDLMARLSSAGLGSVVNADRLRRLVEAAGEVAELRERLVRGTHGAGRSRFGLLVAGEIAEWAVHFPRNPFSVPVAVSLDEQGAELATGLLDAWLARHIDDVLVSRRAEAMLESEADETEPRRPEWNELTDEERAFCPPLLVLTDPAGLGGPELPGLARLLAGNLPMRVLLLDPRDLRSSRIDPTLVGLARREAFVLAGSVAHPRHLYEGVADVLDHDGPALVHVHAPSPDRDGFATEHTIERAQRAVMARVHPLLRYDPRGEGTFGVRIQLAGNPQPENPWFLQEDGRAITPADWAAGERRYAEDLGQAVGDGEPDTAAWCEMEPARRAERKPVVRRPDGSRLSVGQDLCRAVLEREGNWATLREIAGLETPFIEPYREGIEAALRQDQEREIAALRAEQAASLADVERAEAARHVTRLRERLLRLAGFRRGGTGGPAP